MFASRYSTVVGFLFGLVLGCVAVMAYQLWHMTPPRLVTNEEITMPTQLSDEVTAIEVADAPVPMQSSSVIVISNQKQGDSVLVQSVTTPEDAWLTIHEITPEETVGTIIGAVIVESGKAVNTLTIPLLKQTKKGKYLATLYKENGDGVFSVGKDTVLKDDAGTILYTLFTID